MRPPRLARWLGHRRPENVIRRCVIGATIILVAIAATLGIQRVLAGVTPPRISSVTPERAAVASGTVRSRSVTRTASSKARRIHGLSASFPRSYFSGPAGANNILPSSRTGAFLGIWDRGLGQAFNREATFGRKFDILGAMYPAPRGRCFNTVPFSDGKPRRIRAHGAIPIVHYRLGFTLRQINAGRADRCLRRLGRGVRNFGHPVFLRLYHEFNGDWMPYSGCGSRFIRAWRRSVSVVRRQGGVNGVWVWNPSEGYRNCAFRSYPGNRWVDWVAVDGYNRAKASSWCGFQRGWCELAETFRHTPRVALHDVYGPRKPFMIAETGSVEDASRPRRKGNWHRNALESIKRDFRYLKAFIYLDHKADGFDWRLNTSRSSLNGFRTFARDPHFNTR